MALATCKIGGCGRPALALDLCNRHYKRLRKWGDPLGGSTAKGAPQRFFEDVVLAYEGDECLIWPFSRAKGYGKIKWNGKNAEVHRVLCIEVNGPPPAPGMDAKHSCGSGHLGCVTKGHLSWGTRKENAEEMVAHSRSTRGTKNAMAILNEYLVRAIRAEKGKLSEREIGEKYGISAAQAGNILRRKSWGWLD